MFHQDWLVTGDGQCHRCDVTPHLPSRSQAYRLYRLLSDVEDVLETYSQDQQRLDHIRPLVRQLLEDSGWLQFAIQPPDPAVGWSVNMLYEEPDFPLTIQMVAWLPGQVSSIHNHGTWGVVALVSGQEKNQFWQRCPDPTHPDRIEQTGELLLNPGDLISFLPEAIHHIEALGNEPTVSFNLYGVTDYPTRWKFDAQTHTAQRF